MNMEKFHEKLKVLRKEKGLTQQEVADFVHVDRVRITNWENGKREPNFENLSMLACIFDVSIDFLLSDYLEMSKERYLKFKRENMSIFGDNIKRLRKNKGLKQQEIAELLGVKRNTYSDWENGKTEPSFESLVKLVDLFEVSLDWLFGRDK